MNDTIVAISTTLGVGAISIVRVSGKDAINIVNRIFTKNLINKPTHTITYGYIKDKGETIDEVLVTIMKEPNTFTKENIVEINCHGGISTTKRVLNLLLDKGCRLAEPGEFTKRAFLNGRINLIEAEAINDLINTKTDASRKIVISSIEGKTSKLIANIRDQLKDLLSAIEVNIDYPEYEDIEIMTKEKIDKELTIIKQQMDRIYNTSKAAKIIKEGINVTIVGKPNVGKSSILNLLLNEDKAIVTDVAGTTRDIVEGSIDLDGILINLMDTAGIRKTSDKVEQLGVEKSLTTIATADLVLAVFNNNEILKEEDYKLLEEIKEKKHLIIINKIDLEKKLDYSVFKEDVILTNALQEEGISEIKTKIKSLFAMEELKQDNYNYLFNIRQINMLKKSIDSIMIAKKNIELEMEIDLIEIDIKSAWLLLGELIGETYSEELIDHLFSKFCVGK